MTSQSVLSRLSRHSLWPSRLSPLWGQDRFARSQPFPQGPEGCLCLPNKDHHWLEGATEARQEEPGSEATASCASRQDGGHWATPP